MSGGWWSVIWCFIGTFQLRDTVAFETMWQFPSLGRTGFILLKCSPKTGDLVSQVRCAPFVLLFLTQNGLKPTWILSETDVAGGACCGGLIFTDHLVHCLWRDCWSCREQEGGLYLFLPIKTSCVCVQKIVYLVWPPVTVKNLFVTNSERKRTLQSES